MGRRRWITAAALASAAMLPFFMADRVARRWQPVDGGPERPRSYWLESIPELPRFRRVDENITVDVAIVGGGFCGLATAYYLKRFDPSLRVAVLEAQRLGSGASSRNAGGAPRFLPALGESEEADRAYDLLRAFCDENDLDIDFEEGAPTLTLHRSASTAVNPILTGADLQQEIASPYYEAATEEFSNRLHPGKLIAGLVDASQRAGVELYEYSPVTTVQPGRPVWLHTSEARVSADQVVVATNGYTQALGYARDRMLTLHHRVMVTRPLTDSEWKISGLERWPYRREHAEFYTHAARRTADRRFLFGHLLGHRAFERPDWQITADDVANGQRELLRRYPWVQGIPIEHEWHGVTTYTRDHWPIVGPVDDTISLATGFNGGGIVATHYFGHLLAHQLLGRSHQDLGLLRPPEAHPVIPGEFARSLWMKARVAYHRWQDGR